MLDIRYIREHPDEVKDSIKRRGLKIDLDKLFGLDKERIELQQKSEDLRAKLKLDGKPTAQELEKMQKIKAAYEVASKNYQRAVEDYQQLLAQVPNLIASNTPDGDEKNNRQDKTSGEKPKFDFEPLDHVTLSQKLGLFDFEAGARVAGSKFYYGLDKLVRLSWAVNSLAMDMLRAAGFTMVSVPHMVTEQIAEGTGFSPRGDEDQIYKIEGENLHLIATAEIPLTGMFAGETIDLSAPKLLAALSPCYRKEAGAYGKFSKGLYRVHQFDKLEMYIFCGPSQSAEMLAKIKQLEEEICQQLEIPYRVVRIAAGDLSAPAYEKYDIEYWSPADNSYRELTSCSDCTDYQARRLNIRYRDEDGKLAYAHTLNGTAVTSSRTTIALLENHQTKAGEIKIPQALQKYYGSNNL